MSVEKVPSLFVYDKFCKKCNLRIDGKDDVEISRHIDLGHEVIALKITGEEYRDFVLKENLMITKPVFTKYDSSSHDYAAYLLRIYNFKTYSDTKEILVHLDGVYQKQGSRIIAEETQRLATCWCSRRLVSEVEGIIQRSTFTDRKLFNQDRTKIVMENGILDLNSLTLSPFNPNFLTTIKIPVIYDPSVRHPKKFLKFLEDCLITRENITTAIESMANILTMNREKFDVSIINLGRGANGKTSFLNIIIGIFGVDNGCDVSIHEMQHHKYALADLEGKLYNIHDDISNRELNNMGNFKRSVSGQLMSVEQKNVPRYTIIPFTKHYFSANEMPKIIDNSDGTFRRIYLINWDNQFLPGINRIENIDKIILAEEKSAIFNVILRNYKSLIRQKGFRYPQSIEKTRATVQQESDKIQEFVDKCVLKQEVEYITKDDFYQNITEYYKFKNYTLEYSKVGLGSKLPQYGLKGIDKKIDKKTHKVWIDVNWNYENEWVKSNITRSQKEVGTQEVLI